MKKIIIGTRGSKLALIQTDIVLKKLKKIFPEVSISTEIITTKGDKNMNPVPLDSIGKGWFTKEIDKSLINGTIDVAVHSLKDLPEVLPKGLIIAATPKREDAREALVTIRKKTFDSLNKGAVIGTDSSRRRAQILFKRPDLVVESVRGNVLTRLEKLDDGNYDGLILAVAGLKRLGLEKKIAEYFSVKDFIPSPGQGTLAVVIREDNKKLFAMVSEISDENTLSAINAERSFSKIVGGGCKLPIGVYAYCKDGVITIHAMIGSLDGKYLVKDHIKGEGKSGLLLAQMLAHSMLKKASLWYKKS